MKKIFIISCAILLSSCNKSITEKVNIQDIKTYLNSQLQKNDNGSYVENIKLLKVDTISLKDQYNFIFDNMLYQSKQYQQEKKDILDKAKISKSQVELSSSLLEYGYGSLNQQYKDELKESISKLKTLIKEDSLLNIDMEKIIKLSEKSDSLIPNYYKAKCFVTVKMNDKSVSKDTAIIALDKELNILSVEEFKKNIKKIYKPVSSFYQEW